MNKISVKNLVEYRRMSERRKTGFTRKLKQPVEPKEGGGNYWIRSLSAISTAYKENDNSIINKRLDLLETDLDNSQVRQTSSMYQRNIDILTGFVDFDFSVWRPSVDLDFLSQSRTQQIMVIDGLQLQVLPQHVFAFGAGNDRQVGGIWFVTWQEGFQRSDLGVFSETVYRYVSEHYSNDYQVNAAACMAVDVAAQQLVGYQQIQSGEVSAQLDSILDDIRSKLK